MVSTKQSQKFILWLFVSTMWIEELNLGSHQLNYLISCSIVPWFFQVIAKLSNKLFQPETAPVKIMTDIKHLLSFQGIVGEKDHNS